MNKELIGAFGEKVSRAQRILIISHIRPDGDAVGSLLGLGLILEDLGKEVNLVLEDGVPLVFHHLTGADRVYREASGVYDLVIVVDSSDVDRIGAVLDEYGEPDVNIDHHPTNTHFARLNLVQEDAAATTEMIFTIARDLAYPISLPVAEALLTGLLTDSLGFRTSRWPSDPDGRPPRPGCRRWASEPGWACRTSRPARTRCGSSRPSTLEHT